jgi:hypothetical protein
MSGASPSRSNPSDRRGNRLEDQRSTWDHGNVTNLNALVYFYLITASYIGLLRESSRTRSLLAYIAH